VSWLLLDERSALVVAAVMLAVSVAARQVDRRSTRFVAAAAFETAFVCALFSLWQAANHLTRGHTTGGLQRGQSIWHAERVIHLPNELTVQNLIINHPTLVRGANYYYDTAHLTLMVVFLIWLWVRHRDRYPFFRNMVAAFTGMALLIQMVAVAPPRLLPGTGLVDTPAAYGQSVYATFGDLTDQYAAMPSIHVGWAILISYAVVRCSPSPWRWLAVTHGALTVFVVVATANHYWMDGIVAVALLVPAWLIAKGVERLREQLSPVGSGRARAGQIQQGAFS
jgi:hypothetical protein